MSKWGYNAKRYHGHSMRKGGCQIAVDNGVPLDLVKALGCWKSDAAKAYYAYSSQRLAQLTPVLLGKASPIEFLKSVPPRLDTSN